MYQAEHGIQYFEPIKEEETHTKGIAERFAEKMKSEDSDL